MAVPKLRFKEFDNDWINTKVKDLGEFSSGGTPSKDIHDYWNGNIPWISSSDLNEESIFDIRINRFISEDAIKNSATKKIPKNSILLVSRVGVGKVALTNQELCTSQDFTALTPKKDYALFIAYLMKNITPRLLDLNQGTSIKGFVREDLISLPISLPSKAEQTKIASFLSAVDEKISQLTQKHELLSQYKQGMMQKLFSQQIRFKADDGSEFGEWKEKKLGEIFDFFRGEPFSKSNIDPESQFECIHYGELFTKYNEVIDKVYSKTNLKAKNPSNIGDILMPSSDVTPDGLAKASCLNRKGVFLGGDINILRPKYICSPKFFSYLINFEKSKILLCVTGTTVKHVYNKDLKKLEYKIPSTKEEQTKIANFLSAIDQKIEVVAQQIEQAKTWKNGLLQQMFV
ncbi:restriction endonuclease subunit S [Acinetobacter sp. ULE_I010]|uniref:restriction endonuclease subunit S n=1 Tax=Acinetobacter sp. ULE_I010 TaxID=3373065 RepID=UPI003AF47EE4